MTAADEALAATENHDAACYNAGYHNLATMPSLRITKWQILIAFPEEKMWWELPDGLVNSILKQWWIEGNPLVSFIWNWNGTRKGTYVHDNNLSRYLMDFSRPDGYFFQHNLDNNRIRQVQVVAAVGF